MHIVQLSKGQLDANEAHVLEFRYRVKIKNKKRFGVKLIKGQLDANEAHVLEFRV